MVAIHGCDTVVVDGGCRAWSKLSETFQLPGSYITSDVLNCVAPSVIGSAFQTVP